MSALGRRLEARPAPTSGGRAPSAGGGARRARRTASRRLNPKGTKLRPDARSQTRDQSQRFSVPEEKNLDTCH